MLVCPIFTYMKIPYLLFVSALTIVSCQQSNTAHHHDEGMEPDSVSANTILYNQVMDIHDEVMPKMEDLYNMKKNLEEKLKENPAADVKADIELRLAEVDSASKMMMDWMHEFNPPADTADQEQARAYLEAEMEKVKRVKEAILTVLESDVKN